MEEEKEGISIAEVFKIIFSQKWLVLIIAILVTVAGTLGMYLGYNSVSKFYECTFSVNFLGSEEVVPVYPDNTPFNYRDIISRSNLSELKKDERFKSIDVNGMYASNALSISRNDTKLSSEKSDTTYTLRVKAKYFDNQIQAEAFIDWLAQTPIRNIKNLAVEQDLYLRDYEDRSFYEDKVELLNNQVEYLNDNLAALSEISGGTIKNKCLILISQLSLFNQELAALIGEMRQNLYVHDEQAIKDSYSNMVEAFKNQCESKRIELNLLFGKINASDPGVDIMQTSERIETLAKEIASIESRIAIYQKYIEEGAVLKTDSQFKDKLAKLKTRLELITGEYEENLENYYGTSSLVSYEGAMYTVGDIGLVVSIFISFIAGVLISAVVGFAVGYKKKKKLNGGNSSDSD